LEGFLPEVFFRTFTPEPFLRAATAFSLHEKGKDYSRLLRKREGRKKERLRRKRLGQE
jgi:hypothetical protein